MLARIWWAETSPEVGTAPSSREGASDVNLYNHGRSEDRGVPCCDDERTVRVARQPVLYLYHSVRSVRRRRELAPMVLQVLYTAVTTVLPFQYWPHAAVAVAVLVVIYAYAQGRSTTRERDLHARVVILTVSSLFGVSLWMRDCHRVWGFGRRWVPLLRTARTASISPLIQILYGTSHVCD